MIDSTVLTWAPNEKRPFAKAAPRSAISRASLGSSIISASALRSATASPGGTSTPVFRSSIISDAPPPRVAITGSSANIPSTITRPNGSGEIETCAMMSTPFMTRGTSDLNPRKWHRSRRPKDAARARTACSYANSPNKEPPQKTTCTSRMPLHASTMTCCPFHGAKRLNTPTTVPPETPISDRNFNRACNLSIASNGAASMPLYTTCRGAVPPDAT